MRLKRFAVSMTAMVVLVTGSLTAATTANAAPAANPAAMCSNQFFDADIRLGPAQLPTQGPISVIVHGYNRFAGLTEQQFLERYWDPTAGGGRGGWRYPPDNGFLSNAKGQPVEYALPLGVGQEVDRFGRETGAFLAPLGTAYGQRALPPMNLDNFDPAQTCNYHLYKVIKTFKVESGPIAPGFGQMGYGRQYQVVPSLLPGSPPDVGVLWLINNGYLQRVI